MPGVTGGCSGQTTKTAKRPRSPFPAPHSTFHAPVFAHCGFSRTQRDDISSVCTPAMTCMCTRCGLRGNKSARGRSRTTQRQLFPTATLPNVRQQQSIAETKEICDGICFSASSPFARPCCSIAPILLYYHLRSHLPPGIVLISAVSRIHPVCLVRNRKRDRWVILNPAPLTFSQPGIIRVSLLCFLRRARRRK